MPGTDSVWEQGSSFPDLQIFIGADEIRTTSGTATLTLNASGDLSVNIGASQTTVNVISEPGFERTGRYGSSALDQQQYGTAASQPGPSAVPGTSGPGYSGMPPIQGSKLATLTGGVPAGPAAKGIMITSIDAIYLIAGSALTLNQLGITASKFVNNVAVAVTNILAKAANGLQTAIQANPYVTNVPVTTPAFVVTPDTEVLVEWDVTTQAGGSARLYGLVLRCSFNFN